MIKKLIDQFSGVTKLPVEVPAVRDAILRLGVQDKIILQPSNMDPSRLRGMFYRWTERDGVYGEQKLVTLILYSKNVSVEWQRLICCKELLHICDPDAAITKNPEDVKELIDKLIAPMSSSVDFGFSDFMAIADQLALFYAIPILFPLAAREKFLLKFDGQNPPIEIIAASVSLPVPIVRMVVSDGWPDVLRVLAADKVR